MLPNSFFLYFNFSGIALPKFALLEVSVCKLDFRQDSFPLFLPITQMFHYLFVGLQCQLVNKRRLFSFTPKVACHSTQPLHPCLYVLILALCAFIPCFITISHPCNYRIFLMCVLDHSELHFHSRLTRVLTGHLIMTCLCGKNLNVGFSIMDQPSG